MNKPDKCTYPDCFHCVYPDCMCEAGDIEKDNKAAYVRRRRAENPEYYRALQKAQKKRMEEKDPGHYARLQRELRAKKRSEFKLHEKEIPVNGHFRVYKSGKVAYIRPYMSRGRRLQPKGK